MKRLDAQKSSRGGWTRKACAAVALGALLGAAPLQAQWASPEGTVWDCMITGPKGQQGLAFITFDQAGFSGYQLLSTRVRNGEEADERYPLGSYGRGLDLSQTNRSSDGTGITETNQYLAGFARIVGPWYFDQSGRILGNFIEVITDGSGTPSSTNGISFVGKLVPGKRLNLAAATSKGKVTYNCVPYREMPDIGGSWYANKYVGKTMANEFFTMTSFAQENPVGSAYPDLSSYPGIYWSVGGQGAGYDTQGFMMVSSRKRVGFALQSTAWGGTNSLHSAALGGLAKTKSGYRVNAVGVEEPFNAVKFNAFSSPPALK